VSGTLLGKSSSTHFGSPFEGRLSFITFMSQGSKRRAAGSYRYRRSPADRCHI